MEGKKYRVKNKLFLGKKRIASNIKERKMFTN